MHRGEIFLHFPHLFLFALVFHLAEPRDAETSPPEIPFPTLGRCVRVRAVPPAPQNLDFWSSGSGFWWDLRELFREKNLPFVPIWKKTHLEIIASVCGGRITTFEFFCLVILRNQRPKSKWTGGVKSWHYCRCIGVYLYEPQTAAV